MAQVNRDENIATLKITALLREWIAEIENLEAKSEATVEMCDMLIDLHQLLERLNEMLLKRVRKTIQ